MKTVTFEGDNAVVDGKTIATRQPDGKIKWAGGAWATHYGGIVRKGFAMEGAPAGDAQPEDGPEPPPAAETVTSSGPPTEPPAEPVQTERPKRIKRPKGEVPPKPAPHPRFGNRSLQIIAWHAAFEPEQYELQYLPLMSPKDLRGISYFEEMFLNGEEVDHAAPPPQV